MTKTNKNNRYNHKQSLRSFDHSKIEKKWQREWHKTGLYTPDIIKAKKPFYNLWMYPYPSAEGLHAGHAFASTGSDIYGRFMRMQGYEVFQPIGYDSFGIHSENYAIKIGEQPQKVVRRTTEYYEKQLKSLGHGYDWTRTVTTSDVDYYRWTEWLFVQMFKAGLAYRKKAEVNFCPSCKTVLADEQVINGECERCQSEVDKKELEQWFFKITDYADRLLAGLDRINWSQRVKVAQRNWIGKSEGMLVKFKTDEGNLEVFTTRPDTLESATFIAVADRKKENALSKEKKGEFTGKYALNPVNGKKLPIWTTNYVEENYGTGMIMGVPAYDDRDMEFAKKYGIDIVTEALNESLWEEIEKKGWGRKFTNYHLRDWLVSRQRYWGAPIPMIYCPNCQWQPAAEKELPILLPEIADYQPEGTGKGPLANHPEFYNAACPECGSAARRETDVMDTFVDSSWYFLRYPSVGSESKSPLLRVSAKTSRSDFEIPRLPWDPEITKKWLPVDLYFGGAEHSVLHLMYARFVTMVLHDQGHLDFEEPFPWFFAHGLMIKDGAKMSKSRGNVVNPDEYIKKFGADALRLYLAFIGPMYASPDFRDTGMEGMERFVKRVWKLFSDYSDSGSTVRNKDVLVKLHQTIKKVTEDIQEFKYNTAIAAIMGLVNVFFEYRVSSLEHLSILAQLIAPFTPHLAEEAWVELLGQRFSVHTSAWPKYDPKLIQEERTTVVVQVNGKLRAQLIVDSKLSKSKTEIEKLVKRDKKIAKWLAGQKVKKLVFVPGKLINYVTAA